jgi:hypothetical protein
MITKIYGASDDLIEIEGAISDDVDCYNHKKPIKMTFSDGTIATIFYNGEWKINVKEHGTKFKAKINCAGEDIEHTGIAKGCTSYSDVLILDEGIKWVRIKGKTLSA